MDRANMTDTDRLISQRLVLYKNVEELQNQNVEILRTIREVAEQYEGSEAQAKARQMDQDRQELDDLREQVAQHEDQHHSLTVRANSYIKERDMYRRMLTQREKGNAGSEVSPDFGQSVTEEGAQASGNANPALSNGATEYPNMMKDLQTLFDNFRHESHTDHVSLKQQADALARDKSELQGNYARVSSQLTLAQGRYELLQNNFALLKSENAELQKSRHQLQESAAKQDIVAQQVAEDLIAAKSMADGMRNENTNLKAERGLWKAIEARISEDNRSLTEERRRLNQLINGLQNLQNERELSESENRRRLQVTIEALELELQTLKRKLGEEIEDNKKAVLRRENDQDQYRARLDDMVKTLSGTREELVAAKTQRDQLQARVDEIKVELRSAEERASQRTAQPDRAAPAATTREDASDREEELELQISRLRQDLELARSELEAGKVHVERYKAISQASEEEMQSLSETYEQYQVEVSQTISEKDARIRDVEQRAEEMTNELATTNREVSEARQSAQDAARQIDQEKKILESELARVKDDADRYEVAARLHQEDVKAQAAIAAQAQQSYEDELVKHGEAMKSLRDVREDFNKNRMEMAELRAEAEAARDSLAQNEEHWTETRNRYERELNELRGRNDEIKTQNRRLLQQVDSVSYQIEDLKTSRAAMAGTEVQAADLPSDEDNLRAIVRYLRHEKEIMDVQMEVTNQEARRLKQQLEYSQSQLDQAREQLNAERQSQADKEQLALSHRKLMETINELNLFRESSVTLRSENRKLQTQLTEKIKAVEDLTNQLEPLQGRVLEAESEVEMKAGEVGLLQEDRDRWQKRTHDILQKYNRIDPVEHDALKTQVKDLETAMADLQAARDQAVSQVATLQEQVDGFDEHVRTAVDDAKSELTQMYEARKEAMVTQFKDRSRGQTDKVNQKEAMCQSLMRERDQLRQELADVRSELEETSAARDAAIAEAATDTRMEEGQVTEAASNVDKEAHEAELSEARAEAGKQSSRAAALDAEVQAMGARTRELETQVGSLEQRIAALDTELSQAQEKSAQAEAASVQKQQKVQQVEVELAAAHSRISALESAQPTKPASTETADNAERIIFNLQNAVEELRNEVTESKMAAQDSHSAEIIADAIRNVQTDESKSVAEQVAEQVATTREGLNSQYATLVKDEVAKFKARVDRVVQKLNGRLTDSKAQHEKLAEALRVEHEQQMQSALGEKNALVAQHDETMEHLRTKHEKELQGVASEKDSLVAQHGKAVEQLKSTQEEMERLKTEGTPWQAPVAPGTAKTEKSGGMEVSPKGEINLNETQIKDLVAQNPVILSMVRRNVQSKLDKEREAAASKAKEEQEAITEKKLEEAKEVADQEAERQVQEAQKAAETKFEEAMQVAEAQKESAVQMATKRSQLKISLAERKNLVILAKVEVVDKAAQDTPERAVQEVWDEATKAGEAKGRELSAKGSEATAKAGQVAGSGAGSETPLREGSSAPPPETPLAAKSGLPLVLTLPAQALSGVAAQAEPPVGGSPRPSLFGQSGLAANAGSANQPKFGQPTGAPPQNQAAQKTTTDSGAAPPSNQPGQSNIPRPGASTRGGSAGSATGAGQHTGSGPTGERTRGSRRNRGGNNPLMQAAGDGGAQNANSSQGMNPAAQRFVPDNAGSGGRGQKRVRGNEGEDSSGRGGKRARGRGHHGR